MKQVGKLIIAVVGCELVGLISTPFTISAIPTWYQTLNKPTFSPPNWIFAPVWTMLYLLMGISAYLIWIKGWKNKKIKTALTYFLIQLFFNFLWSILFFGLRQPLIGLIEIIIMWLFILITIIEFEKISRPAGYLLIPYFLWVTFATLLNFSIVILNHP